MRCWAVKLFLILASVVFVVGCTAVFDTATLSQMSLALQTYKSTGVYLIQNENLQFSPPVFSKLGSSETQGMTYSCYYDQEIDGAVSSENTCNSLDHLDFDEQTGEFNWSPVISQRGRYEFMVSAIYKGKDESKIFEISLKEKPLFSMNNDSGYEHGDAEIDIVFDNVLNEGEVIHIFGDPNCSLWLGELKANTASDSFRKIKTKRLNYGKYEIHAKVLSGKVSFPCLDTSIDYEYQAPSLLVDVVPALDGDLLVKENGETLYVKNFFGLLKSTLFIDLNVRVPQHEYLDAKKIIDTGSSVIILKHSGKVIAYGKPEMGGDISAVQSQIDSGVVDIVASSLGGGVSSANTSMALSDLGRASVVAIKEGGDVVCWGDSEYCDMTGVDFSSGVSEIKPGIAAFVAIKNNGDVVAWGDSNFGGDISGLGLSGNVKEIISNGAAFIAIKNDGSVVCWGDASAGGDCSSVDFTDGVDKVVANFYGAIALTKTDKALYWGANSGTYPVSNNDIKNIYASYSAFAFLKNNNQATAWGLANSGGDLGGVAVPDVKEIYPLLDGFVLHLLDGSVITSTNLTSAFLKLSAEIDSDIVSIQQSSSDGLLLEKADGQILGFQAFKVGSVVDSKKSTVLSVSNPKAVFKMSFGDFLVQDQDDQYHFLNGYATKYKYSISDYLDSNVKEVKVHSHEGKVMFAVLKNDGSVIATKNNNQELFSPPELASGVKNIYSTQTLFQDSWVLFAAVKEDGSIYTWGYNSSSMFINYMAVPPGDTVEEVVSTKGAFAARLSSGAVVSWGDSTAGGDSSGLTQLNSGVEKLYSNLSAFVALKDEGKIVVTWGESAAGGNSGGADFTDDVASINNNLMNFAALKKDDTVTFWGAPIIGNVVEFADIDATNVEKVYSNSTAYAAIKSDGSVVTWGAKDTGGDSTSVAADLALARVEKIYPVIDQGTLTEAMIALNENGKVIVWGSGALIDTSSVSSELSSGVTDVYVAGSIAVASKEDGSYVVWGNIREEDALKFSQKLEGKNIIDYSKNSFAGLAVLTDDGEAIYYSSIEHEFKYQQYIGSNISKIVEDRMLIYFHKQDGSVFIPPIHSFGVHGSLHLDLRAP